MSGADRALLTALAAHLDTGPDTAADTAADTPGARARVIAGVAVAIAKHRGATLPPLALLDQWGSPMPITIPDEAARPELLGALYETLLDQGTRRRRGAFYTPGDVASVVVSWAMGGDEERVDGAPAGGERVDSALVDSALVDRAPVICDPAVGGGVFLLAAANALAARGLTREAVVGRCLIGADLDPVAVAVSEATLALWCDGRAVPRLVVADALTLDVDDWPERPDVVVGNPPFLSQLAVATTRTREEADSLARRFGEGLGGYADTAALFWVMACRLVSAGGSVALVLPQSTLAVRDAQGVRRTVLSEMTPEVLWLPGQALFGASVDVCIVVVRKRADRSVVLRTYTGVPPRHRHDTNVVIDELREGENWSHLVADAMGVPSAGLAGNGGMIGDRWQVVADFRDQYYGVSPFVVDDPDDELDERRFPRLMTVGLIDPARCRWGTEPSRFARRRWTAPRIDLGALEASSALGPWALSRLVPKVVVATQTSVLEAAVDEDGVWLPSTPAISVLADPDDLWHVAAVLLAPPVTVWAFRSAAGAALARGGLKLRAAQVRAIPLPLHGDRWDTAADLVRVASSASDPHETREALLAAAAVSTEAYGLGPEVTEWWSARLPPVR